MTPSELPGPAAHDSSYAHIFHSQYLPVLPSPLTLIDTYTSGNVAHEDLVRSLAHGLRHEFSRLGGVHLSQGDTLMLLSPNSTLAWHMVLHGSAAAGIRVSPANAGCTAVELLHQYEDSGSKVVATHPASLPLVLSMFRLRNVTEAHARRRIIIIDWTSENKLSQGFMTTRELMDNDVEEDLSTPNRGQHPAEVLVEATIIGVEPQGTFLPRAYAVLRSTSKDSGIGANIFVAEIHQWIAMPKGVADRALRSGRDNIRTKL